MSVKKFTIQNEKSATESGPADVTGSENINVDITERSPWEGMRKSIALKS